MARFISNARREETNDTRNEAAAGFINYYFKGKNGRVKAGVMPLRDSVAREKKIREWLEKDPGNVEKFLANVEISYHPNNGGSDFELPE